MVFEMSANVVPFGTAFGDGQFSTAGTRINILNFPFCVVDGTMKQSVDL